MKTNIILNKYNDVIVTILLLSSLWLAASMLPAFATDFTVNNSSDAVDINPGNGICVTAGSNCTLRAAVMEANALPGADTIAVPAGTYELTITGVDERCDGTTPCTVDGTTGAYVPVITFDASQGDLDITDDVTITGAGSDVTRIEWAPTSPGVPLEGDDDPLTGDRIFQVSTTSSATADIASVVIQGLTVANGEVAVKPTKATDVCIAEAGLPGNAIYDDTNLNAYDIEVIDSTCGSLDEEGKIVDDGTTSIIIAQFRRKGGGIALGGGYATVTYDSTKEGLPPEVISGGEGSSFGVENVSLDDVVVINNWSGGDGGGIHSIVPATISRSKISGNTCAGGNGGGLYNEGDTVISDTLIGKVFDADTAAAHPELTHRNSAENGGAIFFTGAPQTTTTILRSAINGNYAIGGAGIAGREASFDITNTTISSNEAKDVGAGIITSGDVYLQNVTVADNVATTPATSGGAGLNGFSNARFFLSNTLLSNNQFIYPDKPIRRDNCGMVGSNAQFISQGYNLEDGDTCEFGATDQVNTNPLLVALADNGGLTETHELTFIAAGNQGNSPALDTGDDSNCPNNDQRGGIRPFDGDEDGTANCDIGAYELANFTTDLQISNMVAPDEVFKGDEFTVTVTIFNNTGSTDTNVALVTDALPAEVAYVSATSTVGTCAEDTGVVTCTIGDLEGTNGNPTATVTLTLSAVTVADATIAATVSGDRPDSNTGNNTASVNVGVIGVADLALTATADRNSVVVGNEVTVTFTVANLGADDATEVSLFGTIPAEASLVSATPENGTTCIPSGADVSCELGNLAVAGPSINVVVVMQADLTGVAGTVVDVSASVDAKQKDPDESNNTISASVTISAVPPVITPVSSDSGGLCSYNPNAEFDLVLPAILFIALGYLGWRRNEV
jgi:uncharacterized repeat protein (TIGR01451 family)